MLKRLIRKWLGITDLEVSVAILRHHEQKRNLRHMTVGPPGQDHKVLGLITELNEGKPVYPADDPHPDVASASNLAVTDTVVKGYGR
jgi:hypothetical protein